MTEATPHQELLLTSLDFVLNAERRTAIAALLMAPADAPHTTVSILQNFRDRQGDGIVWQLTSGDCSNYMDNNLKPAGIVTEPSHRRYELGLDPGEKALIGSAIGFIAKWGIDYPMASTQDLLGSTRSRGGVRTPRGRFRIYDYFFGHPGHHRYNDFIGRYDEFGYQTRESFAGEIDAMKQIGIIATENEINHEVMLTEEFYGPLHALYQGLKQLLENGPDPDHLAFMRTLFHGADKSNFRKLLVKGKFFSTPINSEILKSWRTGIVAHMRRTPEQPLALHAIREALQQAASSQPRVPTAHLLKLLSDMEEDGWLRSARSYSEAKSRSGTHEHTGLRSMNTYWLSDKARHES